MFSRIIATGGVFALIAVAAVLGVATTIDGVHDGRTLLALAALVAAVLVWRRAR